MNINTTNTDIVFCAEIKTFIIHYYVTLITIPIYHVLDLLHYSMYTVSQKTHQV